MTGGREQPTSRAQPGRRRLSVASTRGVSILETVVALALVATALAALAPVLVRAALMLSDARDETRALALAASRLQDLDALDFYLDARSGTPVTDVTTNLANSPRTRSGTGLAPADPSAAWSNVPGSWDWTTADSRPTTDEGRADFVRRWAVSGLPAPPGTERLLVQVCVRSWAREEGEAARTAGAHRPGDVWLFTVRTRPLR